MPYVYWGSRTGNDRPQLRIATYVSAGPVFYEPEDKYFWEVSVVFKPVAERRGNKWLPLSGKEEDSGPIDLANVYLPTARRPNGQIFTNLARSMLLKPRVGSNRILVPTGPMNAALKTRRAMQAAARARWRREYPADPEGDLRRIERMIPRHARYARDAESEQAKEAREEAREAREARANGTTPRYAWGDRRDSSGNKAAVELPLTAEEKAFWANPRWDPIGEYWRGLKKYLAAKAAAKAKLAAEREHRGKGIIGSLPHNNFR
ncbi:MAG: hypothetical protein JKY65_04525 [Planctomycetes bacterium]|nr:hypothetical protein [Planctomycetota bacterium]